MNHRTAQFISALEQQFSPSDWGNANNQLMNAIGESSIAGQHGQQPSESEDQVVVVEETEEAVDVCIEMVPDDVPDDEGVGGGTEVGAECVEIPPTHGKMFLRPLYTFICI